MLRARFWLRALDLLCKVGLRDTRLYWWVMVQAAKAADGEL